MQITLNNTSITAPSAKTSDDILNQSQEIDLMFQKHKMSQSHVKISCNNLIQQKKSKTKKFEHAVKALPTPRGGNCQINYLHA